MFCQLFSLQCWIALGISVGYYVQNPGIIQVILSIHIPNKIAHLYSRISPIPALTNQGNHNHLKVTMSYFNARSNRIKLRVVLKTKDWPKPSFGSHNLLDWSDVDWYPRVKKQFFCFLIYVSHEPPHIILNCCCGWQMEGLSWAQNSF